MKLQTKIPLKPVENDAIDYHSKILLIGSCFSEHMGNKFAQLKFNCLSNPFGILFHPKAIENLLQRSLRKSYYSAEDFIHNNELYHCFDAHSNLSQPSSKNLEEHLNTQLDTTAAFCADASHVVLTFGTAWVYHHVERNLLVANCHKLPQGHFKKMLLSVDAIQNSILNSCRILRELNPEVHVILTVSPVRHLKDGFVENSRSKAHLLAALHQVAETEAQISYFPSYELLMDELRDYRFYKSDMLHPNTLAIAYIWDKFKQVWWAKDTVKISEEIQLLLKGLAHKPMHKTSKAHQTFIVDLQNKIERFKLKYPHISF